MRYKIKRLIHLGYKTRLGPHWPSQRCHAKTRKSTPCQNPVVTNRNRCRMHGGKSTGPRTSEGTAKIIAANLKHGERTLEQIQSLRKRSEANGKRLGDLRELEEWFINHGYLDRDGNELGVVSLVSTIPKQSLCGTSRTFGTFGFQGAIVAGPKNYLSSARSVVHPLTAG